MKILGNYLKKNYWIIGLVLVLLSLGHTGFTYTRRSVLLAQTFYFVGNILFFDFLTWKFSGNSLLKSAKYISLVTLFIIGLIYGITVDIFCRIIGGLWNFPFLDAPRFLFIFLPGFTLYAFYLVEGILGVTAILKKTMNFPKRGFPLPKIRYWFRLLLVGGVSICFAISVYLVLLSLGNFDLQTMYSVDLNPKTVAPFIFPLIVIGSFLLWIILDSLEYFWLKSSMILELIHGNLSPIIGIFLGGWILAIPYELFNRPARLWNYFNFPFPQVNLFGVYWTVILTWPLHILFLVSLYRLFLRKKVLGVWD